MIGWVIGIIKKKGKKVNGEVKKLVGEDFFFFVVVFGEEFVGEVGGGFAVGLHVGWGTREKERERGRLRF